MQPEAKAGPLGGGESVGGPGGGGDGPTRWFHWINVVCVVALAVLGTAILYTKELGVTDDGKILLKSIHVWFGYVFAAN